MSLGPEALQTQCKAGGLFLAWQYWAAGLQELNRLLKQYAIEHTLLFVLFHFLL